MRIPNFLRFLFFFLDQGYLLLLQSVGIVQYHLRFLFEFYLNKVENVKIIRNKEINHFLLALHVLLPTWRMHNALQGMLPQESKKRISKARADFRLPLLNLRAQLDNLSTLLGPGSFCASLCTSYLHLFVSLLLSLSFPFYPSVL